MNNQPLCLRCKTIKLEPLSSPDSISFFECPNCHRHFARKPGGSLTFRWLHPISLFLYPVIFEPDPVRYWNELTVSGLTEQESPERTKALIEEITLELDDPTQQVRDILGCCASEAELRKYLRCVVDSLRA